MLIVDIKLVKEGETVTKVRLAIGLREMVDADEDV